MKLHLLLSHKAKIIEHDSDKWPTTYYYEVENKFNSKLLVEANQSQASIYPLLRIKSDKQAGWTLPKEGYSCGRSYVNHVFISTANSWVAVARSNFDKNSLLFQQVCEQIGLHWVQRESRDKIILTTLISNNVLAVLVNLCSHLPNSQLLSWLLKMKIEFERKFSASSGHMTRTEFIPSYQQHQVRYRQQGGSTEHRRQHIQDFCDVCHRLGRLCTIKMEQSKSERHPKDIVIKGLPQDITEQQLRDMVKIYGDIERVYLPPSNPEFTSRIAFITFKDPVAALQHFNRETSYSESRQRL